MISVVVPTMWKFEPFADFFCDVLSHPLVSDGVVINNLPTDTPAHSLFSHPKLTHLQFGCNTFVNPAWNTGMAWAKSKIVCLANDDLIFDLRLFDRIQAWYQPHHGAVGLSSSDPVTGDICFEPHTNQACFGFGQLMFVHQQNWIDIPRELCVYFGDNWIFDSHKKRWGSNFLIKNLIHVTPHAQTSRDHIHRLHSERAVYQQLCQSHQIPCWHE